ncbi:hypothetical protein [Streptomyces vinaceus]|uniref:hypothetical protein n=1 Tax=Streptomyces vinaceus TaxID=1960 RepID=UPI0035E1040A
MSKKSDRPAAEGAKQAIAASAGTVAGSLIGGPVGAVIGAATGPALVASFDLLAARIAAQRAARGSEVMSEVSRSLGIEPEELEARLLADERLLELAWRVVDAAQDISLQQKRRALAHALAAAVADPAPARLDIWELLQTAIREIDPPHIRLLHVLSQAVPLPGPLEVRPQDVKYGMSLPDIYSRDPGLELGGYAILQKLISLGLVESALNGLMFGDTHKPYALSDLGRTLLGLLTEDDPPTPDGPDTA